MPDSDASAPTDVRISKQPLAPNASGFSALELAGVTKEFGPLVALDRVDFTLAKGEIHALLGENGAGKSTLMNIVRGLIHPTSGTITLSGQSHTFQSPEDATQAGIGMVHQHFLLVPTFTVAENLALSFTDAKQPWLDLTAVVAKAEAIAASLRWTIPMQARVSDLPVGTQQRVEILKALLADPQILLFDEPTAVLAPTEIEELFEVLRSLRHMGKSLIFVSHKLGEVMALCDRVTVLRRGRLVGTVPVADTSTQKLAAMMVGEDRSAASVIDAEASASHPVSAAAVAPTVLEVTGLSTTPAIDAVGLRNLSFALAPGEILGFAGVDGNGQAELAQVLTGLREASQGTIILQGKTVPHLRPQNLQSLGIGTIPPDRHREGLALTLSVADNLVLEATRLPEFQRLGLLRRKELRAFAQRIAREFDIRADNPDLPAASLSGGNQQKIVIARSLWRKPQLLIAVSPTRGLDVAAIEYVHTKLRERQREGGAIVLISTELDEVIALSTRIAVLYEGQIVGIVGPDTPRESLGLMMGGKRPPLVENSHG